jgi:dTDP-4-amino-4,6-dideoxygalactose transaminase
MERFEEQLARRQHNARYLTSILEEIDGPAPMRWDIRCDNHAHHLYMMRYDPAKFNGLPRDEFVAALNAEGVPCSTGYYRPLYEQQPLAEPYSRVMPCPVAEQACREAIWLAQPMLLAEPEDMEDIGRAIVKIREN